MVIVIDCIGHCKYNYHATTTTTAGVIVICTPYNVIKSGNDLRQVCGSMLLLWIPRPIYIYITDGHDIIESLLKVAFNIQDSMKRTHKITE